jgi:hypothetical protein
MMMSLVVMGVMVTVTAVGAAFGLKWGLNHYQMRSETTQHALDHMVRPDTKNLVSHFGRQMPVSQMPGKTRKLIGIFMPDFDNVFRTGLDPEPPPILELQAVSVGHRNRFRKIEKDIFALIRSETNAAAMARVKVESESTRRLFLGPVPGAAMNRSRVDSHIST